MAVVYLKPIVWVGRSKEDLLSFPKDVRWNLGYALHFAQAGDKHPAAKPLKGFGGAGVLEVVEDSRTDTYRAVYTISFSDAVYVLAAFQKKSKQGIKTPQHLRDLIHSRLKAAKRGHGRR